jgi:hypothetical protein
MHRTTRKRVEEAILEAFSNGQEPAPRDVAACLCDQDCAAGLYEGCSSELEAYHGEYEAMAARLLGLPVAA